VRVVRHQTAQYSHRVTVRATLLKVVIWLSVVLGLGLFLVRVCADGGAMASAYRTCHCRGMEWQLYDRTAADGPRRTLCFGIVRSRTCSQFRGGPAIPCP
jgi:hypothetical protein